MVTCVPAVHISPPFGYVKVIVGAVIVKFALEVSEMLEFAVRKTRARAVAEAAPATNHDWLLPAFVVVNVSQLADG
jgi:hypothetical protein